MTADCKRGEMPGDIGRVKRRTGKGADTVNHRQWRGSLKAGRRIVEIGPKHRLGGAQRLR